MTKVRLLTIAVIGLLVLNLGLLLFLWLKQPPVPGGRRPDGEGPKNIIIERLHFDAEQVGQYEALITEHRQTIGRLDARMNETRSALYRSLRSNEGGADSLLQNLGTLQQQIEATHYAHFKAIKGLCRTNQLPYFDALTHDLSRLFRAAPLPGPP